MNCGDGSPGYNAPTERWERFYAEEDAMRFLYQEEILDREDPYQDIYFLQSILSNLKRIGWTIEHPPKKTD